MRVAFLLYGALYVVIEIVGHQLEQVSWPQVTALDVATALANALLVVAIGVAVLVGLDLAGHRWRRHLQTAALERARLAAQELVEPEPITVHSWRPEPLALPAAPPPVTRAGAANAYTRQAWPTETPTDAEAQLL